MLFTNTSNKDQGFTLIELTIVIFIAGILAAISAPGFITMYQRNQVRDAINTVQGSLREVQREAMRKSKACNITFNSSLNPPTITSSDNCLITGRRTLNNVVMKTSSISAFKFSFKGRTVDNTTPTTFLTNPVTIVVYAKANPKVTRCLVVSNPLGLIRTGTYDPAQIGFTPAQQHCS